MKIYTRLVTDWSGNILEEDSYQYDGPIAECKSGSTTVQVPGQSAEEKSLQKEQTEILRAQRGILERSQREQQLLAPFLFEQAGITPEIDPETGEIIGFTEKEKTQLDLDREEIEQGFLSRTKAALAGELPINPALERELEGERDLLDERLRKQLGPSFETSTPGIQALDEFMRSKSDILEGARRGDLSLSEQLGLAREGSNQDRANQTLAKILGTTNRSDISQGNQLAQGFGGAVSQFAANRTLGFQANLATAQNRASTMGALFGAAGQFAGVAGGIGLSSFLNRPSTASDRRIKKDINKVGVLSNGINVYTFKYIWDNRYHVGVMAQEVLKILPEAVTSLRGLLLVDYSKLEMDYGRS